MRPACPLVVAAALIVPLVTPSFAQSQLPRPSQLPAAGGQAQQAPARPQQGQPQAQQAPQVAPAKPYKPVALKLPAAMNDPGFEAFRKQLGDAAQKKDRAALAKLVVAQGFFWETENGDKADKKKSGIDNLSAAFGLANKNSDGWDMLGGYAGDPTAMPLPEKQGVVCAPADPQFDDKELEEVAKATGTDPGEWGFPTGEGIEVRAGMQPNSPVIEKLGMHFVRVIPDTAPPATNQAPVIKVVTPSGKTGFVSGDAVAPLGNEQLCYIKDGGAWKITGYIGGDQ